MVQPPVQSNTRTVIDASNADAGAANAVAGNIASGSSIRGIANASAMVQEEPIDVNPTASACTTASSRTKHVLILRLLLLLLLLLLLPLLRACESRSVSWACDAEAIIPLTLVLGH